jgi:hypothetical protein
MRHISSGKVGDDHPEKLVLSVLDPAEPVLVLRIPELVLQFFLLLIWFPIDANGAHVIRQDR